MNVLVIDDDQLVAISLKTILEAASDITVCATGHSGTEAISLYQQLEPDILLMDIRMGDMDGLTAAEKILDLDPDARILLLTTFSDDEYIVRALSLGVKGYILKQDFDGIVPALHAVFGGQSVFGGDVVSKLPVLTQSNRTSFDYEAYDINSREQGVIELVAEGLSNREISERMFLSEGTVRNYISSILDKLSLRDRTQLAVFYYKYL